jgi:hypothetical protein
MFFHGEPPKRRLNDLKANIVKLNLTKKHKKINENRLSGGHIGLHTSGTIPKSRYWRGLGKLGENSNSTFRRFQVLKSSKLAELRKKVKLPCLTDHPMVTGDKG